MARHPVLLWPDPRLKTRCEPVGAQGFGENGVAEPALATLVDDMFETMYAQQGRGLAAPQIGVMKRVFVMDLNWKEGEPAPVVCIDPVIMWASDEQAAGNEGCLSIPGVLAEVSRATELRLAYTGLDGQRREELLRGMAAICAQHEYDHLDGIVTFDRLSPQAREVVELSYSQSRIL